MDEEYMKDDYIGSEIESESESESESIMQKIYAGPNLWHHGLFQYQVFNGGYTGNVKELMKKYPLIEKFMCEIGEIETMRQKTDRKGTAEHEYYERLQEQVRG